MFQQDIGGGPPVGNSPLNPTPAGQQNSFMGNAPTQSVMPQFDPNALNTTALQSSPGVMNMVQALKGGM